jgi:hypothetical protein
MSHVTRNKGGRCALSAVNRAKNISNVKSPSMDRADMSDRIPSTKCRKQKCRNDEPSETDLSQPLAADADCREAPHAHADQ